MPGLKGRAREADGAADDAPAELAKRPRTILHQLGAAAAADGASSDDSGIASGKRADAPPRAPPLRLNGIGKPRRQRAPLRTRGRCGPQAAHRDLPRGPAGRKARRPSRCHHDARGELHAALEANAAQGRARDCAEG